MAYKPIWKGFDGDQFWSDTVHFWTLDDYEWDVNSYESMAHYKDNWLVGHYATKRMNEMVNDELDTWKQDYYTNTGVDVGKSKYPIRKGLYQTANDTWTYYDTLESVFDFYNPMLRKW